MKAPVKWDHQIHHRPTATAVRKVTQGTVKTGNKAARIQKTSGKPLVSARQ